MMATSIWYDLFELLFEFAIISFALIGVFMLWWRHKGEI
jgi:hypothetical protein